MSVIILEYQTLLIFFLVPYQISSLALLLAQTIQKHRNTRDPEKKGLRREKDEDNLPQGMIEQTEGEDHSIERGLCRERIWIAPWQPWHREWRDRDDQRIEEDAVKQ